ncbi:hypothetical protein MMC25_001841 [Agyrium rufum]|nr:hypothetical protein [Agyrium rufum]
MAQLPLRYFPNRVFVWDPKFTTKQESSYQLEKVQIEDHAQILGSSLLEVFLGAQKFDLAPPQYQSHRMRSFMKKVKLEDLVNTASRSHLACIDERCDRTGWTGHKQFYTRDWLQYTDYPPAGECQQRKLLSAQGLYTELRKKDRYTRGAERRILFIENPDPSYMLALAASVPVLQAAVLREFLERIVDYRVFVGVSMLPSGFSMEFQLPYYVLRHSRKIDSDPRGLRRSGDFAIPDTSSLSETNDQDHEFIYEAQISLLVSGIDEWFWTAYFCIDTSFGSDETAEAYHNSNTDAPIGGAR